MIAVIIPTYKPQQYIEECFDSLENQNLSKNYFKVYIALNGPKQPYLTNINSILNNYSFVYEIYYINEANVSNARNKMLDTIQEDFIVFLDDDDLISPNYLKNLLQITSEDTMGITNVMTFRSNIKDTNTNYLSETYKKLSDSEKSRFKSRSYFSSPIAKMLHIKMIGSHRFNTNVHIGEDSLFMTEISHNINNIKKCSDDTYYYVRIRSNSASRKKVKRIQDLKRLAYLESKYIKLFLSNPNDKAFILSRMLATLMHVKRLLK